METHDITEGTMDAIKFGTAAAFPASHIIFGIPLQDWMYIFSIIASIFYIIDKLPSIVRRIHGWVERKGSSKHCSNDASAGEPPRR